MKNCIEILMGYIWNPQIAFGYIAISTILTIPIHEHRKFFYLLVPSSFSFFLVLEIVIQVSFTLLFLGNESKSYFINVHFKMFSYLFIVSFINFFILHTNHFSPSLPFYSLHISPTFHSPSTPQWW